MVYKPSVNPNLQRSIRERNIILYNAIVDIFGFNKGKTWDDFRRDMSDDQVRELYKVYGWLWPLDTDVIGLLPKPDKQLRGLYIGETRPDLNLIVRNIVRYSLYTDEVLVVNPFMNPRIIAPQFNPIENPTQYKQDTLEMVYFLFQLAPWIESGVVNMIPNPADFDSDLRRSVWSMAEERWREQKLELSQETLDEIEPRGKELLKKTMYRLPKDKLEISLRRALPDLSDKAIEDQIVYIQELRRTNPLLLNQELPEGGELQIMRYGANLELGLYLGQITGSYLYTDRKDQWNEILSVRQSISAEPEVWSPLTSAFQALEFNFLDKIDPSFALKLKQEGRLESFRGFLRKVWVGVGGNPSSSEAIKLARNFGDELHEQYQETKTEWSQIDKDLLKWLTGSTGVTTVTSAIAKGGMDWQIPALGFCINGVLSLLKTRMDRKDFRQNVPLAVFLDLEKKGKLLK
ncbi:MAG: hypothetical protein ABH819_03760 [Patescibacteria group bacterium]